MHQQLQFLCYLVHSLTHALLTAAEYSACLQQQVCASTHAGTQLLRRLYLSFVWPALLPDVRGSASLADHVQAV
jgi:hypothetical protein